MVIYTIPIIFIILPILAILGMGIKIAHFIADNAFIIGIIVIGLKTILTLLSLKEEEENKGIIVIKLLADILCSTIFMLALLRFANGLLGASDMFSIIGHSLGLIVNAIAMIFAWATVTNYHGILSIIIELAAYLLYVYW